MIHPSYQELMEKVNEINENMDIDDAPVISSRYSLVLAASKRARQLTNGAEPKVDLKTDKQLSVAVAELYEGKINILSSPGGDASDDESIFDEAEAEAAAEEFRDLIGDDEEAAGSESDAVTAEAEDGTEE